MAKEKAPTREEIRQWLDERADVPFTVQPSLKRAETLMRWMEIAYANRHPDYQITSDENGKWFIAAKRGYGDFFDAIVSTIHERCGYCNKVIVQRHNYLVPYDACIETKYDVKYWHLGVSCRKFSVCLSCFNKKRAEYRALKEWNETRLTLGYVSTKVAKTKKEQLNEQYQNNG